MRSGEGIFTISLDFELYWGLRDIVRLQDCRETLLAARQVVPRLLELFEKNEIHATWATVGFLFFQDKESLLAGLPAHSPVYKNGKLNPYPAIDSIGNDEKEDPYHYAPSLIKRIAMVPDQEVASHTFSHYYCLEPGQTESSFRSDLRAARQAAQILDVELKSLVFPRNQFNQQYLEVCRELGFTAYRGNPRSWIYEVVDGDHETPGKRIVRLCDAYVNLSGRYCHDLSASQTERPVEVPASRFLRPYSKRLSFLEPLRLRRIKNDMSHAAKQGLLYHLWWHPHNFGTYTEKNMAFLQSLIAHYHSLKSEYGMRSLNMAEIAMSGKGA